MPYEFDRRRFLRRALSGVGTIALNACGGGGSEVVMAASAVDQLPTPALTSGLAFGSMPDWVPTHGSEIGTINTANSFLSQNANLDSWGYAFRKIVDDYSGGVFNPYWGQLGAMVLHGGGHSATFDNSVVILDLNDQTFKRLSDPTPSNNGTNWISTSGLQQNVDPAFNTTYCEYGDGQPGSAHTYDTLAILPPEDGGAACGSLIRVASFAVHVNMSRNTGWSHRFDFSSTGMRGGKWNRVSVNGVLGNLYAGACSAYDSRRKRFWWTCGLSSNPSVIRYLDAVTGEQRAIQYARGARLAPPASPDSPTMRYESIRDILVLTCTVGNQFVMAFLRCASPELGWVVPSLSGGIPAQSGASHPFDIVADLDKFVLLSAADSSAVYDIVPPSDPVQPWFVTRRPVGGTQISTAHVAGKRWSYVPSVKSFVWMARSSSTVIAYRPFGA